MLRIGCQKAGNNTSGTCFHATSAVDAGTGLHSGYIVLGQCQECGRGLCGRYIKLEHTESHHGTSADDLLRLLLKSTGYIQQFLITHTDRYTKIPGIGHSISGNSDDTFHQRASFRHRSVNGNHSIYVIYNTTYVRRQHGGIDLPSRCGIDQLTLRALRILGLQCLHRDLRIVLSHLF